MQTAIAAIAPEPPDRRRALDVESFRLKWWAKAKMQGLLFEKSLHSLN